MSGYPSRGHDGRYLSDWDVNCGPATSYNNSNHFTASYDIHGFNGFPLANDGTGNWGPEASPWQLPVQSVFTSSAPHYQPSCQVNPRAQPSFTTPDASVSLNPGAAPWQPLTQTTFSMMPTQTPYPSLPPPLAPAGHMDFTRPSAYAEPPLLPTAECSPEYMRRLIGLIHPMEELRIHGYTLKDLSESELAKKKRCMHCAKVIHEKRPTSGGEQYVTLKRPEEDMGEAEEVVQEQPPPVQNAKTRLERKSVSKRNLQCRFHPGKFDKKIWSCCDKREMLSTPCVENEFHIPGMYYVGELETRWKFYPTPQPNAYHNLSLAVAIDCEMGISKMGDSELIRVTVIDYFSSAILVDSLVYPDVPMKDYLPRYSGVTSNDMEKACRNGTCFFGRDQARKAVWQFVGPNTIVVGHSANNDLNALRWIHPLIVDTFLIDYIPKLKAEKARAARAAKDAKIKAEKDALEAKLKPPTAQSVALPAAEEGGKDEKPRPKKKKKPKSPGTLSLKGLVKARLGRDIQKQGNKGHDSLEDAIATRDLAHWIVMNRTS